MPQNPSLNSTGLRLGRSDDFLEVMLRLCQFGRFYPAAFAPEAKSASSEDFETKMSCVPVCRMIRFISGVLSTTPRPDCRHSEKVEGLLWLRISDKGLRAEKLSSGFRASDKPSAALSQIAKPDKARNPKPSARVDWSFRRGQEAFPNTCCRCVQS